MKLIQLVLAFTQHYTWIIKSQKGMVIGKSGQMIKRIGSEARQELETLIENQVYLELMVKVKENWRKDTQFLKLLGLAK